MSMVWIWVGGDKYYGNSEYDLDCKGFPNGRYEMSSNTVVDGVYIVGGIGYHQNRFVGAAGECELFLLIIIMLGLLTLSF